MHALTASPSSIGTTPGRWSKRSVAAVLLGASIAGTPPSVLASVQTLSEDELSFVTAQGSSLVETLDAAGFASDVQALGMTPFTAPLYEGQQVIKMTMDVEPISVQADLSDVIFRANGATQHKSLGELRINQIDVTGTVLWIWVDSRTFALLPP